MTDQGYTKHYYIEGQRIASKIGSGFVGMEDVSTISTGLTPLSGDLNNLPEQIWNERLGSVFYCVDLDINSFTGEPELAAMADLLNSGENREEDIYYYHGDHLGSSSYITDASAYPTQHLQYLPFGEDFIHQQNSASYYSPYTFSAKERDFETNFSYFGARYYDADLSIWLSVDPMSDERPSLSAYNYCQWNPVMKIDPTGMQDEESGGNGNGSGTQQKPSEPKKPATLPTTPPSAPARQDATTVAPTRSSSSGTVPDLSVQNIAGTGADILEVINLGLNNSNVKVAGNLLSGLKLGIDLIEGNYKAAAVDAVEIAGGVELLALKAGYGLLQTKPVQNDIAVMAKEQKILSATMYNRTGNKTWEKQLNQAIIMERQAQMNILSRK